MININKNEATEKSINFVHVDNDLDFSEFCKTQQCNVIIIVGHTANILAKERLNAPLVIYWAHNWENIESRLIDCHAGRLDQIVFVSGYHLFMTWKSIGFKLSALQYFYFINNALDNTLAEKKQNYTLVNNKIRLSFLSYPSKHKGFPEAIEIFNSVKKTLPNTELNIFGSEALYANEETGFSEFKDLVFNDKGEVKEGINLQGMVGRKELLSSLHKSDIAIAGMTGSETFCVSLIEAMSCGVPAVTLNIGGQMDYMHHNQNGYVCVDTASGSKAIIAHYYKKESQRGAMGQYCIETGNKRNYDLIVKQWLDLIHNKKSIIKVVAYSVVPVAKRAYFSVMKKINFI
jgi:glycosyltransferase involved in cell wall biosynthesis